MDVVNGLGKAAIITLVNAVEGCGGNGREKKKKNKVSLAGELAGKVCKKRSKRKMR